MTDDEPPRETITHPHPSLPFIEIEQTRYVDAKPGDEKFEDWSFCIMGAGRRYRLQQLLAWIDTRDDVTASIVCGDFNATLDAPSAALMATRFRPTQREPTAFTPLADSDGSVSLPDRPRMDRCIDCIWVAGAIRIVAGGVCFNQPSPEDPSLWPSDHIGVWADLEFGG